jgi:hypothetical protein
MKTKILLSFAILFFTAITTQGQITEGKYLLGGAFSLYSATNQNSNAVYANIQFGKVVKENTVVGVLGSVAVSNMNYLSSKYKISNYGAGIFYRKYKPLGKKIYFLQEIDALYQHSNDVQTYFLNVDQSLETKTNGFSISYIPGISYAVSKRMQMELTMPNLATVSYTSIKTIDSRLPSGISPKKANSISANVNLNASLINNFAIGFKVLLGK